MRSFLRLTWLFLSLAATTAFAQTGEIAGKWRAEFDTMIGVQRYVFEFKVDGEKVSGTATGERSGHKTTVSISEGRWSAGQLTFVEPLNFEGLDLRIVYRGELTPSGQLKLTRVVSDFATEELVAERTK